MNLNEALSLLQKNNYIVTESLVSNGPKLLAMINDYLNKLGQFANNLYNFNCDEDE